MPILTSGFVLVGLPCQQPLFFALEYSILRFMAGESGLRSDTLAQSHILKRRVVAFENLALF